jgi:hypothetical protein
MNGEVPWSSVFDSTANMRALSAIQAEGLRAASALVDRFVRFAANGLNGANFTADPAAQDVRADLYGATDIAPLIRSWLPMWGLQPIVRDERRAEPEGRRAQQREPIAGSSASMDLERSEATGPVKVELISPGSGEAELWLHNRGGTDFGEVKLHCVSVVADSGSTSEGVEVRFDPASVAMPPRSSRGLTLTVDAGHAATPGLYRALEVVEGHPLLCIPLVILISSAVD